MTFPIYYEFSFKDGNSYVSVYSYNTHGVAVFCDGVLVCYDVRDTTKAIINAPEIQQYNFQRLVSFRYYLKLINSEPEIDDYMPVHKDIKITHAVAMGDLRLLIYYHSNNIWLPDKFRFLALGLAFAFLKTHIVRYILRNNLISEPPIKTLGRIRNKIVTDTYMDYLGSGTTKVTK